MVISEHARAAKMIRQILKEAYPKTKFQVTSRAYAGCKSIRICWVDGPTYSAVESLTSQFQEAHFSSTDEVYVYSNRHAEIPQVKLIFIERLILPETKMKIFAAAKKCFPKLYHVTHVDSYSVDLNDYPANFLRPLISRMDLSEGFKPEMLKPYDPVLLKLYGDGGKQINFQKLEELIEKFRTTGVN